MVQTYKIFDLLLVGMLFVLFKNMFFSKCRTEHGFQILRRGSRSLHGTLQCSLGHGNRLGRKWRLIIRIGHLDRFVLVDIAEAHV